MMALLVVAAAGLVGCGKQYSLRVSTNNLYFGVDPGTKTLEITANCKWTVVKNDDADWYTISTMTETETKRTAVEFQLLLQWLLGHEILWEARATLTEPIAPNLIEQAEHLIEASCLDVGQHLVTFLIAEVLFIIRYRGDDRFVEVIQQALGIKASKNTPILSVV